MAKPAKSTVKPAPSGAAKPASQKREPTNDEICKKAHELFLARGGQHGYDLQDWFEAEKQLRA